MDWKSKKIAAVLESALTEDRALHDITSALTVQPTIRATGTVVVREACVVTGLGILGATFDAYNRLLTAAGHRTNRFAIVSHPEIFDGIHVPADTTIAVVRHNARALLACERVLLNLLQRMSGIATLTHDFVKAVEGTGVHILDTRKTIPGLRMLDKYSVSCGGGMNHRKDLQDGILIKQNHIALAGGITTAVHRALAGKKTGQTVEIEVRSLNETQQALQAGAEALLFVQMSPKEVAAAVKLARQERPKIRLEAAEHLTLDTVRSYASTGVDYVSVGSLTRAAVASDISMHVTAEVY